MGLARAGNASRGLAARKLDLRPHRQSIAPERRMLREHAERAVNGLARFLRPAVLELDEREVKQGAPGAPDVALGFERGDRRPFEAHRLLERAAPAERE